MSEAGEKQPGGEAGDGSTPDEAGAVVFLDPALDPEASAELGEQIGHPVRTLDPARLGAELPDESDIAVVVRWDLGIQNGLEIVEFLRGRGRPCLLPIVMVSEEPTRQRVRAAQRAGATSFALHPYDPDELRERLEKAVADRSPAPAGAEG